MRTLEQLLAHVPGVYADLVDASLPTRTGEVTGGSPDPLNKPAPGDLSVIEHRHKLLRGLRWWCDAVMEGRLANAVGDSPARMCAVLLHHLADMAAEDRAELASNLREWLSDCYPFMGRTEQVTKATLPKEAMDAIVPQAVAARTLGVPVSTVWRRAGKRGGDVKLAEVAGPRCDQSDLPAPWCAHCAVGR